MSFQTPCKSLYDPQKQYGTLSKLFLSILLRLFWHYVSQHLSYYGQKNTLVYSIIICYPLITPIGRNLMALLLIPAAWHVSTTSVTFL